MARYFWVTFDWNALRQNMSRELNKQVADSELKDWLKEAGFTPNGKRWLVKEEDLGVIDPSEVTSCDPADPPPK